jgi:Ca2+-binding EF-hand superfamily protein/CRP-like cAMP-binding protein
MQRGAAASQRTDKDDDGTAAPVDDVEDPADAPSPPMPSRLHHLRQALDTRAKLQNNWAWDKTTEAKERLRMVFEMIGGANGDEGEDGATVSGSELSHMLNMFGENASEKRVDEMLDLVDANGDREIDFEEFFAVMTGDVDLSSGHVNHPNSRPRAPPAEISGLTEKPPDDFHEDAVRKLFDEIDDDKSGFLDKAEVKQLSTKMGNQLNRRHLLDAMKVMDPGRTGLVSFTMFRQWLLDVGHHWSDMIVIPEGQVMAIHYSADGVLPDDEGAKSAWWRLSVLLKLMSSGTAKWGTPHEIRTNMRKLAANDESSALGSNAEETTKEARAMKCFLRPESTTRTVWDLVQVGLLMYVLISVPLRIGFDVDVPFNSFGFWVDFLVDIYFLVDIVMNFRTAVYNIHGVLVINKKDIACSYMTGWFSIDVLSCLPITYIELAINGTEAVPNANSKSIRMIKLLRLLRLAKLLRVARITRMMERYQERLRPIKDSLSGGILCFVIFIFSHLVACMWYYTGGIDEWPEGFAPQLGWVSREYPACEVDDAEWSAALEVYEADALAGSCYEAGHATRYVTAAYWALMTISTVGYGDYTAKTDIEKVFSFVTMMFGALIFASITGDLSASMMARKGAIQMYNTRMDEIQQFMTDRKVPPIISRRVTAYYQALWSDKHVYDEQQLLNNMPLAVSGPVVQHLYTPTLESIALFSKLQDKPYGALILQRLCMMMSHMVALPEDVIMHAGHVGKELFIIEMGEVDVYGHQHRLEIQEDFEGDVDHKDPEAAAKAVRESRGLSRLGRLGEHSFFGELAVMQGPLASPIRVRTVVARCTCKLTVLERSVLDGMRQEFPLLDAILAEIEIPPQPVRPIRTRAARSRLHAGL